MKVFRGPSSKDFLDDSHELVHEVNLADDFEPWVECKRVVVNITKQDNLGERRAEAHIEINAADVFALHRNLMTGLLQRAKLADDLKRSLREIREFAMWPSKPAVDTLAEVVSLAQNALVGQDDTPQTGGSSAVWPNVPFDDACV